MVSEARGFYLSIQMGDESSQSHVSRVAVKLPSYWPRDPTLWFAQAEAQFSICNITEEQTKFFHVVSNLSPDAAAEVRDIILKPPTNPYTRLKEALVQRTAESATQRLQKALDATIISDSKPTQVLRALELQLEGMEANPPLLKQVFLQKLPATVRSIVAANSNTMDLNDLAELADRVYEHVPGEQTIQQVKTQEQQPVEDRLSRLERMFESFLSVNQVSADRKVRSRSNSRHYTPGGKYCFYHWKFGASARKCTSPCSWRQQQNSTPKNGTP